MKGMHLCGIYIVSGMGLLMPYSLIRLYNLYLLENNCQFVICDNLLSLDWELNISNKHDQQEEAKVQKVVNLT